MSSVFKKGYNTAQASVTTNVPVDFPEINQRMLDAKRNADKRFPGGEDPNNHRIFRNDWLMGSNNTTPRYAGYNNATDACWAAFNGISFAEYSDTADIAEDIHFLGVSKTDVNPTDSNAPENGVAVLRAGVADGPWTSKKPVFAGDYIIWKVPDPNDTFRINNSSQDRKLVSLGPLDYHEMKVYFDSCFALNLISKDKLEKSVADYPLSAIHEQKALSRKQYIALVEKRANMASIVSALAELVNLGLVKIITPEVAATQKALAENIKKLKDLANLATQAGEAASIIATMEVAHVYGISSDQAQKTDMIKQSLTSLAENTKVGMRHRSLPGQMDEKFHKSLGESNEQSILWMAGLLGILDDSEKMVHRLTQLSVFMSQHRDTVNRLEQSPLADIRFPYLDAKYGYGKFGQGSEKEFINLKRQITKLCREAPVLTRIVNAEAKGSVQRRVIGVATNSINPQDHPYTVPNVETILGVGANF